MARDGPQRHKGGKKYKNILTYRMEHSP
jgi:hypothetical protein